MGNMDVGLWLQIGDLDVQNHLNNVTMSEILTLQANEKYQMYRFIDFTTLWVLLNCQNRSKLTN